MTLSVIFFGPGRIASKFSANLSIIYHSARTLPIETRSGCPEELCSAVVWDQLVNHLRVLEGN